MRDGHVDNNHDRIRLIVSEGPDAELARLRREMDRLRRQTRLIDRWVIPPLLVFNAAGLMIGIYRALTTHSWIHVAIAASSSFAFGFYFWALIHRRKIMRTWIKEP